MGMITVKEEPKEDADGDANEGPTVVVRRGGPPPKKRIRTVLFFNLRSFLLLSAK